jgi:hypothetical protein
MERLRYVARATGADPAMIAAETASSLGMFGNDPNGLVVACRRMLDKHPTAGALWWLSSRVLTSMEPMQEAWESSERLRDDPTPSVVANVLPDGAVLTVLGWPDLLARRLHLRGDVEVRVVDIFGEGSALVAQLRSGDVDSIDVPVAGLGAAVAGSELLLLEAGAVGPSSWCGLAGSLAACAVAEAAGVPIWLVAGEGRVLPQKVFDRVVDAGVTDEPWEDEIEVVSLAGVTQVITPTGLLSVPEALATVDCPVAAELL